MDVFVTSTPFLFDTHYGNGGDGPGGRKSRFRPPTTTKIIKVTTEIRNTLTQNFNTTFDI